MSELRITTTLKRTREGLSLTVYATPLIEEAIRGLGNGTTQPLELYGREWRVQKAEDLQEALVYHLSESNNLMGVQGNGSGLLYRLDQPGRALIDHHSHDYPITNLSFLRLGKISREGGVTFSIDGVHSLDGIKSMNESIKRASREFCVNFLKPVNMSTTILIHE